MNYNQIIQNFKIFTEKQAKRPYFKPIFAVVSLAVLLATFFVASFFIPKRVDESFVIKSLPIKQNTEIVAGGQPVQWTVMIRRSDIKSSQYLAKLPKGAQDIKVKVINPKQQSEILSAPKKQLLSFTQRAQIAMERSANSKNNFFVKLSSILLADLGDAVENVIEEVIEPQDPNIIETEDSVVVDLTDEIPVAEELSESPTLENVLAEILPEAPTSTSTEDVEVATSTEDVVLETPVLASEPAVVEPIIQPEKIEEVVAIEFETPAPVITEQVTDTGKIVTVSDPVEDPATPLVDVLASTKIPEIFKVGEESKIKIKWKSEDNQEVSFNAYDTDSNGKLDYVEWTVPHLSDQVFSIILISKAFQLDSEKNIIEDVYEKVQVQDGNYVSVPDGNYVQAVFNEKLNNRKDITIYAKPRNPGQSALIQVYPVYTDANGNQTEGPQITLVADGISPDFSDINKEGKYRILLKNLQTPTKTFNLKVSGGIDFDFIIDPDPPAYYNYADTLLVINDRSDMSVAIGNYFLAARPNFPAENVLHLNSSVWPTGENLYPDSNWKDEIYANSSASATYNYDELIKTPIQNKIDELTTANESVNPINYIILTKGIPIRITGTFNSVDSTLAGCLGRVSCLSRNPFYNSNTAFSHETYGTYIVTRLDGYAPGGDISQITALIDRASQGNLKSLVTLKSEAVFILDGGGLYDSWINPFLESANTFLTDHGWQTNLNETSTYLTGQQNVLGYWSWGSNSNSGTGLVRPTCLPGNTYEPGAIGETAVSTSARSFCTLLLMDSL